MGIIPCTKDNIDFFVGLNASMEQFKVADIPLEKKDNTYKYSFKDLLEDLHMEQCEQM